MQKISKKKTLHFCTILSLFLVLLMIIPAFRTFAAEKEIGETETITGTFNSSNRDLSWNYEFSDQYFFLPSDTYCHPFAQLSMGLAFSAFRDGGNEEEPDNDLIAFLETTGFEDIDTRTYDTKPTTDSISYGIGHKKVDGVDIVAVAVCGNNYGAEWASNLTVGDDTLSKGFADSAHKVESGLDSYLEEHSIGEKAKLWITGYSRGAAVANVTAAEYTDSGRFQDVYAYLIATPRTTKEPGDYRNIFNIVRKEDPVAKIPLADWGFKRFGVDMMMKAPETDVDCGEFVLRSAEIYKKLIGSEMVMNGVINYQIRCILDYLLYLLPDSETYTRLLQPLILDALNGAETETELEILSDALKKFRAEDKQQEAELNEMLDYLQVLINIYVLQKTTEELPPILWDPDFGAANLYSEHSPFKYLAGMFASDDPDDIFSENTEHVRLVIYGDVEAEIYDGDTLLKTAVAKEKEEYSLEDYITYPRIETSDGKIVISLTAARSYSVRVTSRSFVPQVLSYTGNLYSGETVRAKTDSFYFRLMNQGDTAVITTSGEGKVIDPEESDYHWSSPFIGEKYSPSVAIALEESEYAHLTVSGVITFLVFLLAFLLIQLIGFIVLAIIRKKKDRQRNIAFTTVWYGVDVLLFAFCELCMWYFVPAYPVLKVIPMVIALLILLDFAWKLYRQNKEQKKPGRLLIYAGALVAFGLLNGFFCGRITSVKAMILMLIYVGFLVAARLLFFRKQEKEVSAS